LQLCVDGRVVRVEGSLVAVNIERYDFRTVAKVKTTSGLQLLNKADVFITDGTDFH
jgi:hypothetical protein